MQVLELMPISYTPLNLCLGCCWVRTCDILWG